MEIKNDENLSPENKEIALHEILVKQQGLLLEQYKIIVQSKKDQETEIGLGTIFNGIFRRTKSNTSIDITDKNSQNLVNQSVEKKSNILKNGLSKTLLTILFKYKIAILFFTLAGFAFGMYIYLTAKKEYRSQAIFSTAMFTTPSYYKQLTSELNTLLLSKSYISFSQKINIDTVTAKKIVSISLEEFSIKGKKESLVNGDSIELKNLENLNQMLFKIVVEVKDNKILPSLEKAIYEYFDKNPFTFQLKEREKINIKNQIEMTTVEYNKLDTLRNTITAKLKQNETLNISKTNSGGLILSKDAELPYNTFEKATELARERVNMERELLNFDTDFIIVSGFSAVNTPVFPKFRHIILWSVSGFGIGFILALLFNFLIKQMLPIYRNLRDEK